MNANAAACPQIPGLEGPLTHGLFLSPSVPSISLSSGGLNGGLCSKAVSDNSGFRPPVTCILRNTVT